MDPIVKMVDIWKRFGAVEALRGANLYVMPGEVVGLVGDNGAGKSTLMKILAGVYVPDKGTIYLDGKPVRFRSARDSRLAGIEMVFQDLALAPKQTVAENIFLGREPLRKHLGGLLRFLDRRQMAIQAQKLLEVLAIDITDVYRPVKELSGGQRQSIAIARTMSLTKQPRLLIMDEPTAALAVKEVGKVLELIKRLKARGISVILISHRLPDVFEVADRIVVMRRGQTVADLPTSQTSIDHVIKLIIGAENASASNIRSSAH